MADGSGAGSSVLTDGAAVYTQGLSETRNQSGTWVSHFALQDGLGSTRNLVSDAAGGTAITDISIFDAFGVQQYKSGSTPTPYGFAAGSDYQLDKDSNLILCGHRYYNPATGRFMSSDPAGTGDNWYAYCNNDPLNATDPDSIPGSHCQLEAYCWPVLGGGHVPWGGVLYAAMFSALVFVGGALAFKRMKRRFADVI